ncbi:MAG: hypothetical protein EXR89_06350 [Methylococcaceae bacterium]|nr:hypothetical protein [Methylococcaceae bacterium]
MISLVGQANAELAHYDGLLQGIVYSSAVTHIHPDTEAMLSSKIEGTQASVRIRCVYSVHRQGLIVKNGNSLSFSIV